MQYKLLKTTHNHYLTHVLHILIRETGRDCQIVEQCDEKDDDDENIIYIISFFHHLKTLPKHYIAYNVEQMHCASFTKKKSYKDILKSAIQCWDYNTKNMLQYKTESQIWMPIPLVYKNHPFINTSISNEQQKPDSVDILFYGSINTRRMMIMKYLIYYFQNCSIRIKYLTHTYNDDLYDWIRRSKIVLNLGYYTNTMLATYRLNEILCHQRAIISEKTTIEEDKDIITQYKQSGIVFIPQIDNSLSNISNLLDSIQTILQESHEKYKQRIEKGQQFMQQKETFFLHHIHKTLSSLENK